MLRQLPAGTGFDVLDIAGNWAWGEWAAQDGAANCVGYVALAELAARP